MLRKLKIKFIAVVMAVVTILFGTIFGLVMHLTRQNIERESIQMMRALAFRPPEAVQFRQSDKMPGNIRLPFFTVRITESGEIIADGGDYYDLSDEEMLRNLVNTVYAQADQSGVLPEYELRYLKADNKAEKVVVFADSSSERAMLNGLIRNFLLIGLIGYLLFFALSLLLAEWVTKPVQKAWNEQKQFIADASHELKTPLTVIMTNAEMMAETRSPDADSSTFVRNILKSAKRMRGLVESLLELARLDQNGMGMQHETVDYSKLINDSILLFEPLFYESRMELTASVEDGLKVTGDKAKLGQVLTILLDNALKYDAPVSSVTVSLKRQDRNCLLAVSGKGDALSREDCKNIFKRFYRVDQSRTDGQSYGLGLSIAESIIREHGGKIWAESKNRENIFYVMLTVSET